MTSVYDPSKTQALKPDKQAAFLEAKVENSLEGVPCIGPATAAKLKVYGITTQYQLFGKFLSFKHEGATATSMMDAMYSYLKDTVGVGSGSGAIAKAIASKIDILIPGSCDLTTYDYDSVVATSDSVNPISKKK